MYEYIIQLLRKLFPTFIDKKKYNLINNYKKTKQYFLISYLHLFNIDG